MCLSDRQVCQDLACLLRAQYPAFVSCCVAKVPWRIMVCCQLPFLLLLLLLLPPLPAPKRHWEIGKERVFSTYHVALSLAVVTVGAILGLEVGGNGALGGHCV